MNPESFSGIQYTFSFRFPEDLDALDLSEIAETNFSKFNRLFYCFGGFCVVIVAIKVDEVRIDHCAT